MVVGSEPKHEPSIVTVPELIAEAEIVDIEVIRGGRHDAVAVEPEEALCVPREVAAEMVVIVVTVITIMRRTIIETLPVPEKPLSGLLDIKRSLLCALPLRTFMSFLMRIPLKSACSLRFGPYDCSL